MSIIETFYNKIFTATKFVTSTPTSSDNIITASTGLCVFRPVTDITKIIDINSYGREFDMVCDDSKDIGTGYSIYIDGVEYTVQGSSRYQDLEDDTESHLNIRLIRK